MMIHDIARISGVTVRTLQYYDRIGLLKPSELLENGYRNYHPKDLDLLQQILFFRELGFPLSQIKEIITSPNYDRMIALRHHRDLLLKKRSDLDNLIDLVESKLNGDDTMSFRAFDHAEYEALKKEYTKEAKERWGDTVAYQEFEERTSKSGTTNDLFTAREVDEIFEKFSKIRNTSPESEAAKALVYEWQTYITEHFYTCTKEILSNLGLMYVADERFKNNIDRHGEGTAEFVSKSIESYCK